MKRIRGSKPHASLGADRHTLLRTGFAARCITPAPGGRMEGFIGRAASQGVHDDLFLRALYLAPVDVPPGLNGVGWRAGVLVVAFDLIFMDRGDADRLKGAVARTTGLPPAQVLFNFSHTHGGPMVTRWHYTEGADPAYLDQVETALVAAAREACETRCETSLAVGRTTTGIAINRRRPGLDGKAGWGPHPDGPVCDEVPVCAFRDATGAMTALLFSASCHPTTLHAPWITAEYPGAAVARLNARFNTRGAIFLQGAGGDTKPRVIARGDQFREGRWEDVETTGTRLADAVADCVDAGLAPCQPDFRCRLDEVAFPLAAVDATGFDRWLDDENASAHRRRWAADMRERIVRMGHPSRHAGVLLHAVQLARDVRLIGVEAELGSELGRMIPRRFEGGVTFALGYTNGSRINLPCDRQLPEGGYGVDTYWEYHWPAPLAHGVDAALDAALERMIREGNLT